VTAEPFPVSDDCGTGGLWAIVLARDADEILVVYPELTIVASRHA
jgi:hypothetical protein